MQAKPIYVETILNTDMDTLWRYTQTPELHEQWDLRFSKIEYLPRESEMHPQRFLYQTRIGFGLAIQGTGETKAAVLEKSGVRISSLAFRSDQPLSLIREGSGYWRYAPQDTHKDDRNPITFATQYDYKTRFGWAGRWFDRCIFRPLFGYATAWSFDSLRIWLECGISPAVQIQRAVVHYVSVVLLMLLWIYQGLVPKLLFPEAGELAIVQHLGWLPGWERALLLLLGIAEISIGTALFVWHRKPWVYIAQTIILILLTGAALTGNPELFKLPFNPLTLSGSMIGLCAIAYVSSGDLPQASRCLRKPAAKLNVLNNKGEKHHEFHLRTSVGR